MSKKINFNYLVIFFFISYLIFGHIVFDDYSVTPDELLHREAGFISLKFLIELFSFNFDLPNYQNIPDLNNDWRKTYGVLFDLPAAMIEVIFNLETNEAYLLRHYLTFLIYFTGIIYFYKFLKNNLTKEKMAFIGVLILISTPRIFSNSFYNSRDIVFLSLMIIATYYCLKLLKKNNFKNLVLSAVFCALASNVRIIGIYLPILTFIFYFFLENRYKLNSNFIFFIKFFFLYFAVLYITWPFLWLNPIENFLYVLKESANYPNHWNFRTLYLGNYLNPENLPWHYFFIWFSSTTPILFLITIICGLIIFIKNYLNFFLKLSFTNNIKLWKNFSQRNELFIFMCFFIPLFFVICLNSTLYNGWRHLYFLYPFIIYFALYGLEFVLKKVPKKYKILVFLLLFFQLTNNIFFIYKSHPIQSVYFNIISKQFIKGNLPVDYFGLGNKKTIDFLITENKKFSISNSSFTPLYILIYADNDNFSYYENIQFNGTQISQKNKSDFIFTNYYYDRNPKLVEKYQIPANRKSYFKLIIDGIVVNEVFR